MLVMTSYATTNMKKYRCSTFHNLANQITEFCVLTCSQAIIVVHYTDRRQINFTYVRDQKLESLKYKICQTKTKAWVELMNRFLGRDSDGCF